MNAWKRERRHAYEQPESWLDRVMTIYALVLSLGAITYVGGHVLLAIARGVR
jgi:hypothetical protein